MLEGGRGGGKSQSVARLLLYLNEQYQLRTVCGRETQNSIVESVYALLSDLVSSYQLAYEVQSTKLIHRVTGSEINFRGFREQGRFNIQGIEGVDILWVDEAQAVTKQTLDVLIPTIRKNDARIFFTMNRHVANDPVYSMFAGRKDCLHIPINFEDNPHCTAALKNEAAECLKRSPRDYRHIWMGEPLDEGEDALFSAVAIASALEKRHALANGYGYRVAGFDIARYGDDKCAAYILQQQGALHWEEVFVDEWDSRDLNYTTGRIHAIAQEQHVDLAAIDEDGMGAGPFDSLTHGRKLDYFVGFRNPSLGYSTNSNYGNVRTVNAYKLRDMIADGHMAIKDQSTIDELLSIKYEFDHQQRRLLVSKDAMRKQGVKSPNRADALIMASSLIGTVKENQDRQYEQTSVGDQKEADLFQIAGVR